MRISFALLLCLTMTLSAWADSPPITLGGLFNLSGRQAELDVPASRGAQLAVDQANAGDLPLGRKLNLVSIDGQSELAGVTQKTKEMLATYPRISALFGFSDSDFVLASAPLAAKQKLLFVTSGATSPRLAKEVPNYLYLACFGDNVQAAAAAEFAYDDLKARTAFVLYDESTEYTRLLQQYFVARFGEMGGKVVGSQSFRPDEVGKISLKAAKADVIFFSAGPQEALVGVRRLRQLRLKAPILGGDSFDSKTWASAKDVSNIFFTTHAFLGESNNRPSVVKFRQDFQAKYPQDAPDAFAALGYDTVNLLLSAIRQSGSADPEKIRETLSKVDKFEGVTGTISFAQGTRIPSKTVSLLKVSKGKVELVKELMPKAVPAP